MKLQHFFIAAVGSIAPLFTLLPPFMPIASAQQPTQQRILRGECTSLVIGEERGSRINMRSGPGIDFDNPDYVLVGQVVNELIDSVSYGQIRRQDTQGNTWQLVEYTPSRTRGWIRTDFLRQVNCGD